MHVIQTQSHTGRFYENMILVILLLSFFLRMFLDKNNNNISLLSLSRWQYEQGSTCIVFESLYLRLYWNVFLSFQTTSFAITNILNVNADVQTFIDSTWSLPESTCSGWCPSCVMSVCIEMMGSSQLYDGEIVYIPGDILVAGLIPMSQTWNRLNHTQACSGLKTSDNVDIMAEAFVYAVMKSRDQYSAMFGNATIGALLFDTCSDANRASQIMLNFESCSYNFMPNNVGTRRSYSTW